MFDAKSLLNELLGAAQGAGSRQAAGGTASSGGVNDLLNRGKDFLGSQGQGIALGSLAGLMLGTKTGRKVGSSAVTYGGLALAAGLAYKAYQNYTANKQGGARTQTDLGSFELPTGTPFDPANQPGGENEVAVALLVAMISAAKADGHIDAAEQGKIFAKIDEAGLDGESKAFLMDELRAPMDIDKVVNSARSPEMAAEIFAVSRLAIDPDHPAEKDYLDALANRLQLDPDLIAEIELAVRDAEAMS